MVEGFVTELNEGIVILLCVLRSSFFYIRNTELKYFSTAQIKIVWHNYVVL